VKFLIDMPLSPDLAGWLVRLGHDAVHAATLGLHRATDSEIIGRAQREGRTVITADLDYPRLLSMTRSAEPSLILFRSGNWSESAIRNRLNDVFATLAEAEIASSIIVVDRDRVRRRRLPLGS
jgi:predicted nuclease of predicted toxin-antitoxin system